MRNEETMIFPKKPEFMAATAVVKKKIPGDKR